MAIYPSYNHNSWGKTKSFDQLEINGWSSDEIWRSCFKFNSCNFKSLLAAPENTFKKSGLNTNHNLAVTEFLYLANVVSWEVVNAMVRLGMRNIELWWNAVVRREPTIRFLKPVNLVKIAKIVKIANNNKNSDTIEPNENS